MSANEKDIFNKLFQESFQSHREVVEEENWDFISAKLDQKRFYKFNPSKFNIYYAAVAAITGVTVIGLILFNSTKKTDPNNKEVLIEQGQKVATDSIAPKEKFVLKSRSENKSIQTKRLQKEIVNTKTEKINSDTGKMSIPIEPTEIPKKTEKEIAKEKAKEKVYIIYDQDTIVETDSVKVKRRKRKK